MYNIMVYAVSNSSYLPELILGILDGLLHAVLLNVHVVCVQMNGHIVHANIVNQGTRLQSQTPLELVTTHAAPLTPCRYFEGAACLPQT